MIGETLSITYDGAAKVLNRINQDNYTSEYFLEEALYTYRVFIRHSNESVRAGQPAFERHTVDLIRTVKPTLTTPEQKDQVYTVIRRQKASDPAIAQKLTATLCAVETAAFVTKVVGWES